jgi:hypothetical protein
MKRWWRVVCWKLKHPSDQYFVQKPYALRTLRCSVICLNPIPDESTKRELCYTLAKEIENYIFLERRLDKERGELVYTGTLLVSVESEYNEPFTSYYKPIEELRA